MSIEWGDENRQPGSSSLSPGCCIIRLSYRARGQAGPHPKTLEGATSPCLGASHSPEASVHTYGVGSGAGERIAERTGWWGSSPTTASLPGLQEAGRGLVLSCRTVPCLPLGSDSHGGSPTLWHMGLPEPQFPCEKQNFTFLVHPTCETQVTGKGVLMEGGRR